MFTLESVLAEPTLGLSRIDGGTSDPTISWAHVSELSDPRPWLAGEELLLTTGLELFHEPGQAEPFLGFLVERGVSALGISTGASLPHSRIPDELIRAADALGFPLVHVPEQIPLQTVVRFVSGALNHAENEPLRRALLAQRKLAEALSRPDGLSAVIAALGDSSGISSAVYDLSFRRLAQHGDAAGHEFSRSEASIRSKVLRGGQWVFAEESEAGTTLVHPIGVAGVTRGLVVSTKAEPMTFFDRTLVGMTASMLGMLLELRHSSEAQLRAAAGEVVRTLIGGDLTEVEAALQLASVGVRVETLQVLVLPADTAEDRMGTIAAQLGQHCAAALVGQTRDDAVILLCDPGAKAEEAVVEIITEAGTGAGGLGMRVDPAHADLGYAQATRARDLATTKQEPISALSANQGYRALLALGNAVERAAFSDAVLSPIDAHDARYGADLEDTLRTFFRHAMNAESAARALGIHRHTMRTRLDRIHALTGRNLSNPDDILELWLACESRLVASGTPPRVAGAPPRTSGSKG